MALWNGVSRGLVAGLILAVAGCGWGTPAPRPSTGSAVDKTVSAQREPISAITGDSPNFAQMSNGTLMTVVSRDFGRGAKPGALVELYYPHYATDHLWDSYVGIGANGHFKWAHDLQLVRQQLVPDSGIAVSTFRGDGYTLTIEDVVRPEANAHVRHVTVTNTGMAPLNGLTSSFYGFFILGGLPGGNRLHVDRARNALVQSDDRVAIAVSCNRPMGAWQCGDANLPLGQRQDARMAAEAQRLPGNEAAGPLATGVNGVMQQTLGALAPGASVDATYVIGVGGSEEAAIGEAQSALEAGWEGCRREDLARWGQWLSRAHQPQGMPAAAAAVYRRALVTMEQSVNDVGGIIAAPTNLNPPYRFVWPRDGSFIARCLQSVGFDADARRCFEFQERLQRPDGGWAVNYFPDGSRPLWEFGAKGDEHDEVGTFVWGVDETFRADGDTSWLAARWPAVQKACDFLLRQQQANGLLTTCRDLWELDSDGSWTYSNGAAWAGLQAGARIAQQLGHDAESERYLAAASRLKAAIEQNLVFEGVLVRGARGGGVDRTLEAANLALGSNTFGVWSDSDPRLKQTADAVGRKLISPWGGIRRYEGDRYYDGQPWPVSTAWLGMVRLAEGDRAGAQALFDTMTRYAQQTDALMLGEQFDEANKRWVSAFPLNWSEAVYVQFAQQLYGN